MSSIASMRRLLLGFLIGGLLPMLSAATVGAVTYMVANLSDSGPGSLRAAIASARSGSDIIAFQPGLTGIITLTSGPLIITHSMTIMGTGPTTIIIDGNNANTVFAINTVPPNLPPIVVLTGLTIQNGVNGITIFQGTLTVTNSAVINNSSGAGGGIYNYGNTLTIIASTISGNIAHGALGAISTSGTGGGIYTGEGKVTLINSTVSGNSATVPVGGPPPPDVASGGGIYNAGGIVTLTNSTVSGNAATAGGGIIGNARIQNTIIAGNTSDVSGTVTSLGYNLIGNSSGGSGFLPTDLLNVNPRLAPLGNNGGPTQTMALLPGSPAIDAVPVASSPVATDQRGVTRPQGAACDIGAFEAAVQVAPPPRPGPPPLNGTPPAPVPPSRSSAGPPPSGSPTPAPVPPHR